jgi:hypothetical protein
MIVSSFQDSKVKLLLIFISSVSMQYVSYFIFYFVVYDDDYHADGVRLRL